MSRKWVVNASPLITLGKIGWLSLLNQLTEELAVPQAVKQEINAGSENDAARIWLAGQGAQYIRSSPEIDPTVAGWDLGAGENAVMTFARQHAGFEAIINDRAARNCAITLRIPVRGTLGVILLAKEAKLVPNVKTVVEQLHHAGLCIDNATVRTILELAGE